MPQTALLEAIKAGLKGERDSITVYSEAASRAQGEIKAFFLDRAAEEKKHFNWLLEYYTRLINGDPSAALRNIALERADKPDSPILSEDFLRRIASDQYLTTAIATAVLLEATAMRHYMDSAESTVHEELRQFFHALAEWESSHYDELLKIQEESRQYWFEVQRFEPF